MPHINLYLKAQIDDKVQVLNYRKKPMIWETGTVEYIKAIIHKDGTYSLRYEVRLDRTSDSKSRTFPNGGAPIFLTVNDHSLNSLKP